MWKEFNVGEAAWWATCGSECKKETCPICFGKRVVVLILGNGDEVQTPCDYCGKGYEGARGWVQENYAWSSDVKQIVIDSKKVTEKDGAREIEYRTYDHYCPDEKDLFATKEEADARVLELIAAHEIEQAQNMERRKEYGTKSYAWHVGYHQRCAKKARHDLEYHEAKVIAMKVLAKPEKPATLTNLDE